MVPYLVSTNHSSLTSSSPATRREAIDTFSVDEAKDLISPTLLHCDTASMKDPIDITTSFAHFQARVFNSLTPISLLTFETRLQHLLAMSNILIIFHISQQKVPYDIMMNITSIVSDINCGLLTKLNAVANEACFNDADNDLQDRPDGCIKKDGLMVGYLEVKPIDKAKDHKKIKYGSISFGCVFQDRDNKLKADYYSVAFSCFPFYVCNMALKNSTRKTECMFERIKNESLSPPNAPSSHLIQHTTMSTSRMEWSFHPTDQSSANTSIANESIVASNIANNSLPISFFDYSTDFTACTSNASLQQQEPGQRGDHDGVSLPTGWTLAGRKRSIFELDTNIHTLSQLYSTLVDLRNQLPDTVADQVEQLFKKKPSLGPARSSTEDYMFLLPRSESVSNASACGTSAMDTGEEQEPQQEQQQSSHGHYDRLRWTYPDFIFESLVHVYLDCICFTRTQPKKLLEQHRQGTKLDKAYICAIYAYAALHALLCHPEKFGIYSFMNQLAVDAYQAAFDMVEFDSMDAVTCETLVIMYQYLLTVGQDGEARNLFCLAQRQMELLLSTQNQQPQDVHRLYVWMAELDWDFALTKFTVPLLEYSQLKPSLDQIKPVATNFNDDQLYVKSIKFKIKGLRILLSNHTQQPSTNTSSPSPQQLNQQLNQWRTRYLETFLYKRHAVTNSNQATTYTLEDKLALRLHALYFAGMLELHQQHMLQGFESDRLWQSSKEQWPDYFSLSSSSTTSSFEISSEQSQVEKGLYRSMNAAYGFIQVIRLLLDEMDRCILPQVIDTLSAACTVLYFGNKVVLSNKEMIQKSQEALSFVVHAFLTSTTFAMMECPRIDRFVKKWGSLMS
ncbi:hypothetical protein [Parasitella parasitica]|uniref:Transcription factor domain-containing protein n=1 Tax=Parasitella parasitica TaxID=35722 RepID=A0A0B7MWN0_9FUNG|nr:hypothetical protein [Parasitella parasitica]